MRFGDGQHRPEGGNKTQEMRGGVRGRRPDCRVAKKRFQALITLSNGFPTTCTPYGHLLTYSYYNEGLQTRISFS